VQFDPNVLPELYHETVLEDRDQITFRGSIEAILDAVEMAEDGHREAREEKHGQQDPQC
jgi:hypothetical protein